MDWCRNNFSTIEQTSFRELADRRTSWGVQELLQDKDVQKPLLQVAVVRVMKMVMVVRARRIMAIMARRSSVRKLLIIIVSMIKRMIRMLLENIMKDGDKDAGSS